MAYNFKIASFPRKNNPIAETVKYITNKNYIIIILINIKNFTNEY